MQRRHNRSALACCLFPRMACTSLRRWHGLAMLYKVERLRGVLAEREGMEGELGVQKRSFWFTGPRPAHPNPNPGACPCNAVTVPSWRLSSQIALARWSRTSHQVGLLALIRGLFHGLAGSEPFTLAPPARSIHHASVLREDEKKEQPGLLSPESIIAEPGFNRWLAVPPVLFIQVRTHNILAFAAALFGASQRAKVCMK